MQLPSDPGALVTTMPGHGGIAQPARRRQPVRKRIFMATVPVVRIERTTYRLQGGCSTPELNRQGTDPIFAHFENGVCPRFRGLFPGFSLDAAQCGLAARGL